jgi:long-subunit acyl-CoA synthetase (AMP-forming)
VNRHKVTGDCFLFAAGDQGDLSTFVRVVLGAQAVPTYNRTEAAGTITASMFFDYSADTASRGAPVPCNEVKLIDLPDQGYLATDQPNPRGEICVRGNNVFSGYWGDSNTTDEVLDGDKWFMTGDIGEWLPNGTLRVIASKKII